MTDQRKKYRSHWQATILPLRQFLSHLHSVKRNLNVTKERPVPIGASFGDGSFQLLGLPEELLIRILSHLPFKSLICCRSISGAFNTLITQSTRLQYAIALETHHFIDNLRSSLPPSERLHLLRAREEASRLLEPKFNRCIDVPHHASRVHDLNGGIFLLGDSVTGEEVVSSNGSAIPATKAVNCLVLQSLEHFTVGLADIWKSFDLGRDILSARMAIQEHDLIALVTTRPENSSGNTLSVIEIQLLQYSTGNPHPFATLQSLLITRSRLEAGRPAVNLEIVGRYLAILAVHGTSIPDVFDQFVLFDWKKGTVIMSSQFPFKTYDTLTFLTAEILLFTNVNAGSLDIFRIPSTTSADPHPLFCACSLVLPRLRNSFFYCAIFCHTDPKNSSPTHQGDHGNDDQGPNHNPTSPMPIQQPFYPSPSDSIVLFHIGVQNTHDAAWGDNGMRVYSLVVHRKSLLAPVPPSHTHTRTVPWKDWGPRSSRLFNSQHFPTGMIALSVGERYVRLAPDHRIHLLDFNPYHVRLQIDMQAGVHSSAWGEGAGMRQRGGSVQVVQGRTLLEHSGDKNPWRKELYSELPHVLTVCDEIYPIGSIVMDEERLIGLHLVNRKITSICVLHFG